MATALRQRIPREVRPAELNLGPGLNARQLMAGHQSPGADLLVVGADDAAKLAGSRWHVVADRDPPRRHDLAELELLLTATESRLA